MQEMDQTTPRQCCSAGWHPIITNHPRPNLGNPSNSNRMANGFPALETQSLRYNPVKFNFLFPVVINIDSQYKVIIFIVIMGVCLLSR